MFFKFLAFKEISVKILAEPQLSLQKLRNENPGEAKDSDFQGYSGIFKCPVLNNKITMHTKKFGSMAHSKEKKKFTETIPKETQTSHLLDKDFKPTVFGNACKN